jgi:hypothetical protein
MPAHLQIGKAPPINLPVGVEAWIRPQYSPTGQPVSDVKLATTEALAAPIGFPPLQQAIVPGDVVAIALGEGVRRAADVIRGILAVVNAAVVPTSNVRVVVGRQQEAQALGQQLVQEVTAGLDICVHDPTEASQLAFVAAVDDQPLRLNRHVAEADVVIPVACARHSQALLSRGPCEAIYPRYSDADSIRRYQQASVAAGLQQFSNLCADTARVGWLVGASLVVEIVPKRGGGVASVLAGQPEHVSHLGKQWCDREWGTKIDRKANLVITSLSGDASEQTWANVARALHAARQAADESHSAVVVCTELNDEPGPALLHLGSMGDEIGRGARHSYLDTDDVGPAWELFQTLEQGPVYFMSRLSKVIVEELGMAPLEDYQQLGRLVSRSGTCLILNDAQHAVPVVAQEATSTPTD